MNYFEIIDRVIRELKYPTVATFGDLVNPEQVLIKSMINTVNREVLSNSPYNCREKLTTLTIPASSNDYTTVSNTINGEIKKNGIIVDKNCYTFVDDISEFLNNNVSEDNYTIYGSDFYFGSKDSQRTATILYYTNNFAVSSTGTTKTEMVLEDDESIIPSDIVEQILVYGTCFKFKGSNSADARMAFWANQYNTGIKMLDTYNQTQDQQASIKIPTNTDIRKMIV